MDSDMECLRKVARKLLGSMEGSIEQLVAVADKDWGEKNAPAHRAHELLYGSRTSVASTLAMLADLLPMLDGKPGLVKAERNSGISDVDIEIMRRFIDKRTPPEMAEV